MTTIEELLHATGDPFAAPAIAALMSRAANELSQLTKERDELDKALSVSRAISKDFRVTIEQLQSRLTQIEAQNVVMREAFTFPTKEECEWVVSKLTERNPNLFTSNELTPAQLLEAAIVVWFGSQRIHKALTTQPTTSLRTDKEA